MMTKEEKKLYKHNYYKKNKESITAKNKLYRIANREKLNKARKVYYEANKEVILAKDKIRAKSLDQIALYASVGWKASLKYKYGMTGEQYYAMLEAQEHKCKICGNPADQKLFVDHCHTTNKVRGLLCRPCNSGLGFFLDRPDLLEKAKQYIYKAHSLQAGAA